MIVRAKCADSSFGMLKVGQVFRIHNTDDLLMKTENGKAVALLTGILIDLKPYQFTSRAEGEYIEQPKGCTCIGCENMTKEDTPTCQI